MLAIAGEETSDVADVLLAWAGEPKVDRDALAVDLDQLIGEFRGTVLSGIEFSQIFSRVFDLLRRATQHGAQRTDGPAPMAGERSAGQHSEGDQGDNKQEHENQDGRHLFVTIFADGRDVSERSQHDPDHYSHNPAAKLNHANPLHGGLPGACTRAGCVLRAHRPAEPQSHVLDALARSARPVRPIVYPPSRRTQCQIVACDGVQLPRLMLVCDPCAS